MENEVIARLENYLQKDIYPKDLALRFRRLKLELVKFILQDTEEIYRKDWVSDGLYYLDNLVEMLDPYLEEPPATEENL